MGEIESTKHFFTGQGRKQVVYPRQGVLVNLQYRIDSDLVVATDFFLAQLLLGPPSDCG